MQSATKWDEKEADAEKTVPTVERRVSTSTQSSEPGVEADYGADSGLKRKLSSRHLYMISLGTAIGTALWLGSGSNLTTAGPVGMWIGFWIAASIAWALMQSVGELTVMYPVPSAFPRWSISHGWAFWLLYTLGIPTELAGLVTVMQFWTDKVPPAAWISIFLFILVLLNAFPVRVYAESESIMSFIKFAWIFVIIIASIVVSAGGGPKGHSIGFRYWREAPFTHGFKGFLSVMPNAVFSMSGIELVGIAAAEAKNPKKSVPKSVGSIWLRLGLFYIIGILMVTIIISPYSPDIFGGKGANASPFVIAFRNAGIPGLSHAMNAIILISVFSAANSEVYTAPRILVGLAEAKMAPKWFLRCDRQGRPLYGFFFTILISGGLAYLNVNQTGSTVFQWFESLVSLCVLYSWGCIFLAHLRFRKAWKVQGYSADQLPWKSRFFPLSAIWGISWCILICIIEFYLAVWPLGQPSSAKQFFATYLSIVLIIIIYVGAKIYYRGPFWKKPSLVNLNYGRRFYTNRRASSDKEEDELYVFFKSTLEKIIPKKS
ncbi:amino acid permease [Schizosaccharomyces cryophilus OY26]|uniref:Amino acid permease n=1 Tax=Schizosaccharomyces cryophilus (strain OY26 / ATCC MYA-4695 / CBS 11777 / NBRC 106824 / NRRL Y48691) TaxID=653667 RepID=S9W2K6_SCHCR|nr:amino acid permease [Schizosaccharomyces cryophilus OY26]EPY52275.1 amino acid permease [Schizosaccharomyces cryophilus OY26]